MPSELILSYVQYELAFFYQFFGIFEDMQLFFVVSIPVGTLSEFNVLICNSLHK